jgi:hypothetical protein
LRSHWTNHPHQLEACALRTRSPISTSVSEKQRERSRSARTSPEALRARIPAFTPFLAEDEVAEVLGISVKTLRNRRGTPDHPPHIRLSRSVVIYPIDDLCAYIEARRVGGTEQEG